MTDSYPILEKPIIRWLLCIPLIGWAILYFTAPYQPESMKLPVDVHTLYDFDMFLFGALPTTIVPRLMQCIPLDTLAGIVYTIHSGWPVIFLTYLLIRRRDIVLSYVNCFGVVSLLAVATQMAMPTSPPWYYYKYQFAPASYALKGDPAGLERVDEYYHIQFFYNMFYNNPVVFGSFPSLHIGWPSLMSLFIVFSTRLPRLIKRASIVYVLIVSWAVIYLQHHYAVDVLGGMFYAWMAYTLLGPKKKPGTTVQSTDIHGEEEDMSSDACATCDAVV